MRNIKFFFLSTIIHLQSNIIKIFMSSSKRKRIMGLFENLFGKKNNSLVMGGSDWKTLSTYTPVFRSYNERIYESELVVAAIDARARHISKLDVEFIGSAKPALRTQMRIKPNSFQTWSQFLYRLSVILDMQGTAFIVPVYDKYGNENGFFPILPSSSKLVEYNDKVYIRYTFNNNKTAAIELDKVGIMTRHQYKDDLLGTNNDALKTVLGVMDLNNQGIKEAIKASASYKFMAQVNNFTKSEDLKKERQRFTEENLKGDDNGLLLFPNTYNNIKQVEPKNYILDEKQMSYIRTSVFDYFGISEDIIQNKANKEVFESFYEGAIEPLAVQFCQVMTNMVYTELEQAYKNEVRFYSNKLERLSVADKMSAFDRGLLTINEGRAEILGLPPIEGGDMTQPRGEYHGREDVSDENNNNDDEEGEDNAN